MCLIWAYITCAAASTFRGDTINGEKLVGMGRQMNNPLLTLIGMAIMNQHPCFEWTIWTSCSTSGLGNIGIRSRTRICSLIGSDRTSNNRTEEDLNVCFINEQGTKKKMCPPSYKITANGYCLKRYDVFENWERAEEMCQRDGGHLVHIDSDEKFSDVKKLLQGVTGGYIWVDGRRKQKGSHWETVHGVKLTKFYWTLRHPGSYEECIALSENDHRQWHSSVCKDLLYPLCEIIV